MFKIVILVISVIFIELLQGCSLSPDIEGIVDKGGKAIATIQVSSAIKELAHTREIKAKTSQRYGKDLMNLIEEQSIDKQADLISESIQAQVDIAENNTFKGMLIATAVWSIFLLILRIAVFLFNRYKPIAKKTTKEY